MLAAIRAMPASFAVSEAPATLEPVLFALPGLTDMLLRTPLPQAMRGMFAFHGLVLDVGIINILPLVSEKASDAQRVDKFPVLSPRPAQLPRCCRYLCRTRTFLAHTCSPPSSLSPTVPTEPTSRIATVGAGWLCQLRSRP